MKLAFFGTPPFAARLLDALLHSSHEVVMVVSAPDAPVGRGLHLTPSAVSALALEKGLPLERPEHVGALGFRRALVASGAEAAVVAAYGKVLGPKLLASLPLGFVNVHTSLLPRWRGAGPVQAALLAGDARTGVSYMVLSQGLDEGPVLKQTAVDIQPEHNAATLLAELGEVAAAELPGVLTHWRAGRLLAVPQTSEGVTYAPRLTKADGHLDWRESALRLHHRVQAVTPWPGAQAALGGAPVLLSQSRVATPEEAAALVAAPPGALLLVKGHEAVLVKTGEGALWLGRAKPAGKKDMPAAAWLRGVHGHSPVLDVLPQEEKP